MVAESPSASREAAQRADAHRCAHRNHIGGVWGLYFGSGERDGADGCPSPEGRPPIKIGALARAWYL